MLIWLCGSLGIVMFSSYRYISLDEYNVILIISCHLINNPSSSFLRFDGHGVTNTLYISVEIETLIVRGFLSYTRRGLYVKFSLLYYRLHKYSNTNDILICAYS
jgi:hypothetical protein